MKTCKDCKQTKPLDEFYKSPTCKDGHATKCKSCISPVPQSLTKQVLAEFGEDPLTTNEVAAKLGIDARACRSRVSLLQKRGDIVFVDYIDTGRHNNIKRYVRAGTTKSLPLDTLLCHASNDWLRQA